MCEAIYKISSLFYLTKRGTHMTSRVEVRDFPATEHYTIFMSVVLDKNYCTWWHVEAIAIKNSTLLENIHEISGSQ